MLKPEYEPHLTQELDRKDFALAPGSTYIFGSGSEPRSQLHDHWRREAIAAGVQFVEVADQTRDGFDVHLHDGTTVSLQTRGDSALVKWLVHLSPSLYLDITGLSHSTWAPLLRAAIEVGGDTKVVYVEPEDYMRSSNPALGLIYDLSARIEGIAPLPGFARVAKPDDEKSILVALLGFEGARFEYLLNATQMPAERVVPIIGMPGFQLDNPYATYAGNRIALEADYLHSRVQFAKANCPFDVFHEVLSAKQHYGASSIKIAPIGTKPHGLGAVLLALSDPRGVELIYDHPIRAVNRSSGSARVCLYDVGKFVESGSFSNPS